jgi:hypothetical protein
VSNWALPGHECRHNLLYWQQGEYRGIGCAAHSHRGGRRWWNVRTPERYISAVGSGRSPEAGAEELDRIIEAELEALPCHPHVWWGARKIRYLTTRISTAWWRRRGRAVLTLQGRLLANEVAIRRSGPDAGGGPCQ